MQTARFRQMRTDYRLPTTDYGTPYRPISSFIENSLPCRGRAEALPLPIPSHPGMVAAAALASSPSPGRNRAAMDAGNLFPCFFKVHRRLLFPQVFQGGEPFFDVIEKLHTIRLPINNPPLPMVGRGDFVVGSRWSVVWACLALETISMLPSSDLVVGSRWSVIGTRLVLAHT